MATATLELVCPECGYDVAPVDFDDEAGMCNCCLEEEYRYCDDCGKLSREDNCKDGVCPNCLLTCPECDGKFNYRHWYKDPGCCTNCYYDLYEKCSNCRCVYDRNDLGNHLCSNCQSNRWTRMVGDCAPLDASWEDWTEFTKFTQTVDFGCKFDCEGECSGTRAGDWRGSNGRGCCRDCARNQGYLKKLPVDAIEEVSNLYDDNKGFWRPGGCVLPIEYRSLICLTYYCDVMGRRRNADIAGIKLIKLYVNVISRKGDLIRITQQLQAAQAEGSTNVDSWKEMVESAQKGVIYQTKQWEEALEKVRVEKAAKAARSAFVEQMLQAGYYSELGYEVDSESVEQLMQLA